MEGYYAYLDGGYQSEYHTIVLLSSMPTLNCSKSMGKR